VEVVYICSSSSRGCGNSGKAHFSLAATDNMLCINGGLLSKISVFFVDKTYFTEE
jgi:hypothetical protein